MLLLIAIIAGSVLYGTMYLFLSFEGKNVAEKQLEFITKKSVKIGQFSVNPPLNICIKNLEIKDLLKIESFSVSPSLFWLLTGGMVFDEIKIVRPYVTYERLAQGAVSVPQVQEGLPVAPLAQPVYKNYLKLSFRHLQINDGQLDFIDRSVGAAGIKIMVKEINFSLTNLYKFPASFVSDFQLRGKIPWAQGSEEGTIEAEGWANFFKMDMQAVLKISDIDGVYLYPYYANSGIDLQKARIERAKLNFTSDIRSLNNDLIADCHLELTDIVRKAPEEGEPQGKAALVTDKVLEMFKNINQGKIKLDFMHRTKMDSPDFGFGGIKTAVEDTIAKGRRAQGLHTDDVLMLPAKVLESMIKTASDLSRALISGTFAVGKELKDSLKESFRREEHKEF